jgi:hypothetical protein
MPDPKQRCDAEGGAEKSVTAAATWTIIAASPAPTRLAISFPAYSLPSACPWKKVPFPPTGHDKARDFFGSPVATRRPNRPIRPDVSRGQQ